MKLIAGWIDRAVTSKDKPDILTSIKGEIKELTDKYPLYPELSYN